MTGLWIGQVSLYPTVIIIPKQGIQHGQMLLILQMASAGGFISSPLTAQHNVMLALAIADMSTVLTYHYIPLCPIMANGNQIWLYCSREITQHFTFLWHSAPFIEVWGCHTHTKHTDMNPHSSVLSIPLLSLFALFSSTKLCECKAGESAAFIAPILHSSKGDASVCTQRSVWTVSD